MSSRLQTPCDCNRLPAVHFDDPLFTVSCSKCHTAKNPDKAWQMDFGKTQEEAIDVWEKVMRQRHAFIREGIISPKFGS